MPGSERVLALAPGVSIAVALALVDILAAPPNAVIGIVVLAPVVTVLFGTWRDVAAISALAIALVVASGLWSHNFGDIPYFQRIFVIGAVGFVSGLAARSRTQVARDRERFAVLSAIADTADGTRSLQDTVAAINELVVPAVADICIVDAVSSGNVNRLAVRVSGSRAEADTRALLARPPATVDTMGDRERPQLVASIDEAFMRHAAVDDDDLAALRALRALSTVIVPLRARGRRLGTLTLITTAHSGRRFDAEDLEFAKVLSGRAALALDNAGLFSELETIEAQLTAALSTLAEAVTVQHAEGALIYANEAAARMLGYDSPNAVLATPVARLFSAFETTNEDGSPLRAEDLPGRRVLSGLEPTPLVVRSIERATGEETWRMTKASGVYDRDGKVKLVVNVIEDITEVKRAEMAQRLLARAGELLGSSLDYERTLQQVAELAVPQLADWCTVALPDGQGFIRTVAVAHADAEKMAFAARLAGRYPQPQDSATGTAAVIRDGVSSCVNEITDDMLQLAARDDEHLALLRGVGMRAALTVPMSAAGTAVGAMSLISAESARRFSPADVELAEELARRAGSAVENARLYTERSHIARTLQTELLPGRLPEMPGWRVATLYRPAGDENWVGGDFYDAFEVRGGWLAIVGDVAGRGAEAAALTGLARHTLRTAAKLLDDPLDAVGTLNAELRARAQMSLCSVAAVLLREDDGRATAEIVCAGHPLPLLARAGGAEQVGRFSPMLGAYAVESWHRTIVELEPGDVLVLYTDGVFDAVGEGGRFGEDRLRSTVAGVVDAHGAVARIDRALTAFAVADQADDTAVLAVERLAAVGASAGASGERVREDPREL